MRLARSSSILALAALALSAVSSTAIAQPRAAVGGIGVVGARSDRSAQPGSLKDAFGIPVAARLIQSDDANDRIRGIERLGALGTTEAIDALVEQIEQGSPAARDTRAKITAVRVLAAYTRRDNVRQILAREAADVSAAEGRGLVSPLASVVRATAALALARGGDKKSLASLVNAILQGGLPAEAATNALRAYPPASLESFLEGRKRLSPTLATFLGELGDLRAIDRLRAMLTEKDPTGQIAAAVALGKLGDDAAAPLAREWLKKSEPRLRRAAAEVLVHLGAPDAAGAVAGLLASETTREDGLRLALASPKEDLASPLALALPSFAEASRPEVIAAIGRAGGARAIQELTAQIGKPDLRTHAAHALAVMPGKPAREALEKAIVDAAKKPDARRLILRASVVRAIALGDPPAGLEAALEDLRKAEAAADRAVAAFGLVATGAVSLEDLLEGACSEKACDVAAVAAAARGALAGAPKRLDALSQILAREANRGASAEQPSPIQEAAAAALLIHPDGGALPTSVIATWAEAGGPLAPLAARAIPSRDAEALRGRLKRLLEGSDPVVRAHVALGLAHDPEPSAVSLLTSAYRFEDDAGVRRAIVRSLSRRAEAQRMATLIEARDLDPDDDVRALARAALGGRDLDPGPKASSSVEVTRQVAWVVIAPNEGKPDAQPRSARISRADGLAIPVVADPDGVLLVPGMLPGTADITLGR